MADHVTSVLWSVWAVYPCDMEASVTGASTVDAKMGPLLEECVALKQLLKWSLHSSRPQY